MTRRWPLAVSLALAAVGFGCVGTGDPFGAPTPTPDPDGSDCADVDCGPDPGTGADCGGCPDGTCVDGTCETGCLPATCASLGATCGQAVPDGCGGTLLCGTCPTESSCQPDLGWQCGCTVAGPAQAVVLQIDAASARVHLTLRGETGAATATDHGGFVLEPAQPRAVGYENVLFAAWDGAGPRSEIPVRAVAGHYTLRYDRRGADPASPWPLNRRAFVAEVDLAQGTELTFDIPAATVDLDLRVGGVPVADLPAPTTPVLVSLRGLDGQGTIDLWSSASGPVPPRFAALPGRYALGYQRTVAGEDLLEPWPLGRGTSLGEVSISADGPLVLDVPAAVVDLALEVDGAWPAPEGDLALHLQDPPMVPAGGMPVMVGPPIPTALVPLRANPQSVFVLATITDVRYVGSPPPGPWPVGRVLLGVDHAVGDGLEFAVQTAVVGIGASLGGAAISTLNTAEDDVGELQLARQTARGRDAGFGVGPLWAGAPATPELRVVRGDYDVLYTTGDRPSMPHWPLSRRPYPIELAVPIDGDSSLSVDVPVSSRTVEVAINGGNTTAGTLDLSAWAAPGSDTAVSLGWSPLASLTVAAASAPAVVRTIPGSYQVSYKPPETPDPAAPTAAWILEDVVSWTGGSMVQIEVDAVPVTLSIAANGDETAVPDDHARLWLTRLQPTRATVGWTDYLHDGAAGSSDVRLPPGLYAVQYYPPMSRQAAGAPELERRWPETAGVNAGCLIVSE